MTSQIIAALKRQGKWLPGMGLCLLIFLVWSWTYRRMSALAWQTPLGYGGDGFLILGSAKAFLDGDIFPLLPKWVAHLNAPFTANWNDYPMPEQIIPAVMGWLGKTVGLFTAANFMVLLAHLLAGLSFWYVGRELKYRSAFVFTGAVLFAFSHYMFVRSLSHVGLTYCWHVPLMLLASWRACSAAPIKKGAREWLSSVAIAAVSGMMSVYYLGMFLQFLGLAVLLHLSRRHYRQVRFPLLLLATAIASFLIVNGHTLGYSWVHGKNHQAVIRNLAGLELYALKIPELVFPPSYHRWHGWAEFGQKHYFVPTLLKGELGSPYLGLAGLAGAVLLAGKSLWRILQGRPQMVPIQAWQTLWILLFSLGGGINLLLGTFGFLPLRSTNRYSVFILALVLLFLVRQLSREIPRKWVAPVALGLLVMGLWDQLPPQVPAKELRRTVDSVRSDRDFAEKLEAQLPQGALVFQLPPRTFPEAGPVFQMQDYEHFRPYLYSRGLHYSYGTNRGRVDADWQIAVGKAATAHMAKRLESFGFAAVMINRRGYEDSGVRLVSELTGARRPVLADNGDLIAIGLRPAASPVLPEPPVYFSIGWSEEAKEKIILTRARSVYERIDANARSR